MLLPILGGSAAVWNTCLVFFQVSLLVGYLWAHALARWLPGRPGMVAHIVLLAAACALLPVSVVGLQNPPTESNPIPWLLETLLVLVGPPFVFLAATAPTLQAWFARTGDRGARDPYFLYAASNLGSLAALVSYPSAIEPSLPLAEQSRWWSAGYLLLIGLTAICALLSRGAERERGESGPYIELAADEIGGRLWLLRVRWVLLACLPSSLLLGVTSHLTSDVASALRPGPLPSIRQWRAAAADILLPALMLALILVVQWDTSLDLKDMSETAPLVLMIIIAGAVFGSQHRPIRFSLGLAAIIAG